MFNLIVLASRPDDWTHDEFIEWWRGEHAEVTYPLPGLLRWQHTELLEAFDAKSRRLGWPVDSEFRVPATHSRLRCRAPNGRPQSST